MMKILQTIGALPSILALLLAAPALRTAIPFLRRLKTSSDKSCSIAPSRR